MVRSLLRASQMVDADILEEIEHDFLVHEDLVTSGTLNFQDGTISGTGDVYANAYYGDGSTLSGVGGGGNPDTLYYDGTDDRVVALIDSAEIRGDLNTLSIQPDDTSDRVKLNVDRQIIITGSESDTIMFYADSSGAASLYYAGSSKFQTVGDGVLVYNGTGDNLRLTGGGTDAIVRSITNSNSMVLQATNSSAEIKDTFSGDPDGAAELYYAGVKGLETILGGISVYDSDASDHLELSHNGAHVILNNKTAGGGLYFWQNGVPGIVCQGTTTLYNSGTANLVTSGAGIQVKDGTETMEMIFAGVDFYFRGSGNSGKYYFRSEDASAADTDMVVMDPVGSVELYYAGVKKFETSATGSTLTGILTTNGAIITGTTGIKFGDEAYLYSNGTSLSILNDGSSEYLAKFTQDSSVELYFDGTKTVETTSEGISVTGGGVKFPATQVPSSDVNTLDDYDEYTAANTACTGALTVSAMWKLVKVGNLVTLTLPAVNGTTSDVAAITFGVSVPTKYRPTESIAGAAHVWVNGAGLAGLGVVQITTGGVISVYRDGTQSLGWGTAVNSGMLTGVSVSWVI